MRFLFGFSLEGSRFESVFGFKSVLVRFLLGASSCPSVGVFCPFGWILSVWVFWDLVVVSGWFLGLCGWFCFLFAPGDICG